MPFLDYKTWNTPPSESLVTAEGISNALWSLKMFDEPSLVDGNLNNHGIKRIFWQIQAAKPGGERVLLAAGLFSVSSIYLSIYPSIYPSIYLSIDRDLAYIILHAEQNLALHLKKWGWNEEGALGKSNSLENPFLNLRIFSVAMFDCKNRSGFDCQKNPLGLDQSHLD